MTPTVRPRRPRGLITALKHLREARIELIAIYRTTEAAELQELIRRLEEPRNS